jgi:predicted enzyme related to lactoylglutathione lyase
MKSYDDVYKTPGAFSWSELMTSDPQAACTFYNQLFGWKIEAGEDKGMGLYHHIEVDGTAIGGIMAKPPGMPAGAPSMWGCYVTVADLDQTLSTVQRLGGKVLVPPMDVEGVGRMAVIGDPQGAALSVMQYKM